MKKQELIERLEELKYGIEDALDTLESDEFNEDFPDDDDDIPIDLVVRNDDIEYILESEYESQMNNLNILKQGGQ